MIEKIEVLPLIPLRGITIFPYMVLHFDVGREKSLLALEEAMIKQQRIFLATQKDAKNDDPESDDIFDIGTICNIKQILKLPGETARVLVEGETRGMLKNFNEKEPFFKVEVKVIVDEDIVENKESEALVRIIRKNFDEYIKLSGSIPSEVLMSLDDMNNPGRLSDVVSSYINLKQEQKQELLATYNVDERLEKLLEILNSELDILKLERKIGVKVKSSIDKIQKDYYLKEQMKAIQEELGVDDEDKKEFNRYKTKINKAKLPKYVKEKAIYELDRLKSNGTYSPESGIIKTYLDWLTQLPWNTKTDDNLDLKEARKVLESEHYGLEDVKNRVMEYIAVRKMSSSLKGPILCLVGPPGVGKTSIAKSVAHALNRNFVRMSLGGMKDEAEIRGHRKTYIGAIPGRIIYAMKQAKSKNPLFLLDEIDKMSSDYRGDPADALLEVLDSEQNNTFRDHYLELDFDLSEVLFITTANTLESIPRPLLDRMEIIEVSGYTSEEKFHIAKKYLISKKLDELNIKSGTVSFSDSALYMMIENYTRESGVRSLERQIAAVIRKSIAQIVEKNKKSEVISVNQVKKYLGPTMFEYEKTQTEDQVGVVMGMAWTAYGGDTLPIEASIMPGTGKLMLTGKLGDVMKESAKAGFSYIRANADKYGIEPTFYKNKDIHIHVPEGAVPKDGPSAGVTMITAVISALTGQKVRHNISMTGEITLTGRVIPIGGLKEKTLAAYRAGIDTIIFPSENEKDLLKIPKNIKNQLKMIPVSKIDEVLEYAIIKNKN